MSENSNEYIMQAILEEFPNYIIYSDGKVFSNTTNRYLTQSIRYGYYIVQLTDKDFKRTRNKVHRLVAKAFVKNLNPSEYDLVKHIDENKLNNYYTNLQWTNKLPQTISAIAPIISLGNECIMQATLREFPDYVIHSDGKVFSNKTNKYLTQRVLSGYYAVSLINKDSEREDKLIHRLVATAFVKNPNPSKYHVVDHIDNNKLNNDYANLQWLDIPQNNKKSVRIKNTVYQYTVEGVLVKEFITIAQASQETGTSREMIRECCYQHFKNVVDGSGVYYIWKFKFKDNDHIPPSYNIAVCQFNIDGSFIEEFANIKEAANKTNTNMTNIYKCCEKIYQKSVNTDGGFSIWEYKTDKFKNEPIGKIIEGLSNYIILENSQIYSKSNHKYLKPSINGNGYYRLTLKRDNGKRSTLFVHRLVMLAYRGESTLSVNHINSDKSDNRLENLEYVTGAENSKHAYDKGNAQHLKKAVHQIHIKTGKIINTYSSINEASRVSNIRNSNIARVCSKSHLSAGGYKWRFVDKNHENPNKYCAQSIKQQVNQI
jgi:hypothetical protein